MPVVIPRTSKLPDVTRLNIITEVKDGNYRQKRICVRMAATGFVMN